VNNADAWLCTGLLLLGNSEWHTTKEALERAMPTPAQRNGNHYAAARASLHVGVTLRNSRVPAVSNALLAARLLEAQAEISRLAGNTRQAQRHLRAALQTHQDIRRAGLAEQVKTELAVPTNHAHGEP